MGGRSSHRTPGSCARRGPDPAQGPSHSAKTGSIRMWQSPAMTLVAAGAQLRFWPRDILQAELLRILERVLDADIHVRGNEITLSGSAEGGQMELSGEGTDGYDLCPGRELPPRVGEEVMAFGDGAHRCPGNALAIQESDVLLNRLLALPVRLASEPVIGWDELIHGYTVRNFRLELTGERTA